MMQLQAKDRQGSPGAGRGMAQALPRGPRKGTALWTPGFQTSGLQTVRGYISVVICSGSLGRLIQ